MVPCSKYSGWRGTGTGTPVPFHQFHFEIDMEKEGERRKHEFQSQFQFHMRRGEEGGEEMGEPSQRTSWEWLHHCRDVSRSGHSSCSLESVGRVALHHRGYALDDGACTIEDAD